MIIWIFNELVNLMHVEQIGIQDEKEGNREITIYFTSGRILKGTTKDTESFDKFREWLLAQVTDQSQLYPGEGKFEEVMLLPFNPSDLLTGGGENWSGLRRRK